MSTRLSDNRDYQSATVSEGDSNFARLARLEITIQAKRAKAEKQIADIKARLDADTAADSEEYNSIAAWLDMYILANKQRFVKPRMRQTEFGRYGLRTATKLSITSDTDVVAYSDQNGMALYSKVCKIDKKSVEKAICEGASIPGCRIISGDIAKYDVDKKLLNAEIKKSDQQGTSL